MNKNFYKKNDFSFNIFLKWYLSWNRWFLEQTQLRKKKLLAQARSWKEVACGNCEIKVYILSSQSSVSKKISIYELLLKPKKTSTKNFGSSCRGKTFSLLKKMLMIEHSYATRRTKDITEIFFQQPVDYITEQFKFAVKETKDSMTKD